MNRPTVANPAISGNRIVNLKRKKQKAKRSFRFVPVPPFQKNESPPLAPAMGMKRITYRSTNPERQSYAVYLYQPAQKGNHQPRRPCHPAF